MRRPARRASLVVGLACLAASVAGMVVDATAVHAADPPGSGFLSLSLNATATGQHVVADKASGQAPGSFDGGVPFTEAGFNGPTARAFSTMAWPGDLLGNLGTLIILSGGPDQASAFNDPVRAQAQTAGKQDDSYAAPGLTMTAHATDATATSQAALDGDQNTAIGTYGATDTQSTATLTGARRAVARATSRVQDVSLAGGQVTIESVTSEAHGSTDGVHASADGRTVVSGMKVGGVPVTVDEHGVHVASQTQSLTPATDVVDEVLANAGLEVFLSQPTRRVKGSSATYDAGSLVISFKPGMVVALGGAHVTAAATPVGSTPLLAQPPVQPGPAAAPTGPGLPSAPPAPAPAGTATGPVAGPAPSVASAPAPQLASRAAPLSLFDGISPGWVVLALLGAGLFAGGLRRLPDRLLDAPATTCPLGDRP